MAVQPDPQAGNGMSAYDQDLQETREWMEALSAVIEKEGPERAHFLLEQLLEHARQNSIDLPFSANTGYVNTIEPTQEARCPGNIQIEKRLRAYMRWNAMAMVVRANRLNPADGGDLGGHIGSFASVASMFGAGFNHFWHAESENHGGDLLYIQGHSAPGIYARAFLEGLADKAEGQALIKAWNEFARRPELRSRLIFVRDYNMRQAEWLVQGVDVWINTPRRPWEASGTSGMKILANGGLNLSELDGWWAEAYEPEVGWAIGDGEEHGDDPAVDEAEADALYSLLEDVIVPEFYSRNQDGIPSRWIERVRESMARLAPRFSTNRTVREYAEKFYLPAVVAYQARAAAGGKVARELARWKQDLDRLWPHVHFGAVNTEEAEDTRLFSVEVYLGELLPEMVRVELYAEPARGENAFVAVMTGQDSGQGSYRYRASIPPNRPVSDFTPRIVPYHPLARLPLEDARVAWQR